MLVTFKVIGGPLIVARVAPRVEKQQSAGLPHGHGATGGEG